MSGPVDHCPECRQTGNPCSRLLELLARLSIQIHIEPRPLTYVQRPEGWPS